MTLATKGHEIQQPADVFKDPVVMEFLGLPESPRLVETDLEQSLINNLQAFLLELEKGVAFTSRQERISLDGDHFYIDLVFYHTVLKCYVLIDAFQNREKNQQTLSDFSNTAIVHRDCRFLDALHNNSHCDKRLLEECVARSFPHGWSEPHRPAIVSKIF